MSHSPADHDPADLLRAARADTPNPDEAAQLAQVRAAFAELTVERRIGEGGMATVYRAVQPKLQRTVALKVLKAELATQPEFQQRFEREARALASLDHPRILRVLDFGERGGLYYLLTDYVDGADLRRLLELGQLGAEEALRLAPQICEALRYAHLHGVVHRDVKPENILIDLDGNVRIADFGLARIARGDTPPELLTRTTQVLGTPHYMAPEQWRSGKVDHRADIFSLGVVLYEMLTGTLPIGDFASPSQREGVPERLDGVVRRALAQDPERRFQKVEEFESALERGDDAAVAPASRRSIVRGLREHLPEVVALAAFGATVYGGAMVAGWLYLTLHGTIRREGFLLPLGAMIMLASTAFATWALHALRERRANAWFRQLAAFAVWLGPIAVFVLGLLGLLATDDDVRQRGWILVAIAAVLTPLAVWFLCWRAWRAGRDG